MLVLSWKYQEPAATPNEGGILMTQAEQAERRAQEAHVAERVAVRIRQQVLETLGTPPGWHAVQVRPLWADYFRVNVLVGESINCFTIAHSFFLLTDGEGGLLESTPQIFKRF
jgi:hypothetical protein